MRTDRLSKAKRRATGQRALDAYNRLSHAARRKRLRWPVWGYHNYELRLQRQIEREAAEHQRDLNERLVKIWRIEVKSYHREAA